MEVSVVIAVYNAEKFLPLALDSVLMQEEVREVLLVEDGSPDNALAICQAYTAKDPRVVVLRHPHGENRGAPASFNLGIRHARYPFVAFLGADDQYVRGRFTSAKAIFEQYPDAHGAYAHIGVIYYDPEYRDMHLRRVSREISGMHADTPPEDLQAALLLGTKGHISLDSLVVRREILTEDMLFDESLRQGQDTDFLFRLSGRFRLYSTAIQELVALRGVHAENRVFNVELAAYYSRILLRKCICNRYYGCRDRKIALKVIHRYLKHLPAYKVLPGPQRLRRYLAQSVFLLSHPRIALHLLSLD